MIALVDSTTLWNLPDADPDRELVRDHAVYITGVSLDDRGHPVAFRLNDTGRGELGRDTVVSAGHLRAAFELPGGVDPDTGAIVPPGGHAIVTDTSSTATQRLTCPPLR